jgi:hypothetical protein
MAVKRGAKRRYRPLLGDLWQKGLPLFSNILLLLLINLLITVTVAQIRIFLQLIVWLGALQNIILLVKRIDFLLQLSLNRA